MLSCGGAVVGRRTEGCAALSPITIVLPWPHRILHPNARAHWAARAAKTAKARSDACYAAQAAGARALGWPAAHVSIVFHAPDKRRRDLDGMLSSVKCALDGIADATGIDDSRWTIAIERGESVKFGAVVVTVRPV